MSNAQNTTHKFITEYTKQNNIGHTLKSFHDDIKVLSQQQFTEPL